ncbi:MAG: hypothetical protein KatS3mg129_0259 [Leptospiraceae bacterium]|nr:MAG: hypothetical protein KatS3mg129_0259 [Leptospiraceae bacterium]
MANPSIIQGLGLKLRNINLGIGYDSSYLILKMQNHKKDYNNYFIEPKQSFEFSGNDISHSVILGISQKIHLYSFSLIWGFSYHSANYYKIKGKIKSYEFFDYNNNQNIFEQKAYARINFPEFYRTGIQMIFNTFKIYFDINYILWNSYFRNIKIYADLPFLTTPFNTKSNQVIIRQNWKNQLVYLFGIEKDLKSIILSFGYNYGKLPTPEEGFHPLLTLTIEHHLTIGLSKKFSLTTFYISYEHGFKNKSEFELSRAKFISDWFLFHAIKESPSYFKYNRTMQLHSLIFGIESKI